jgi:hypothetical protein
MRTLVEPVTVYDKTPAMKSIPPIMEMDYSRILNKPYFVSNVTWSTSQTAVGTHIGRFDVPSGILNNSLVKLPFFASTYFRAKIKAILQVSGTPMHQGIIIASAMPAKFPSQPTTDPNLLINSYLCAPHVFLSANESTPVLLEVPFYVNTKLSPVGSGVVGNAVSPTTPNCDYASILLTILNPLATPSSATTTLTISVHIVFEELEFYVPHNEPVWTALSAQSVSPVLSAQAFVSTIRTSATTAIDGIFQHGKRFLGDVIDAARSSIRYYTGLHSPNKPILNGRMAVQPRQNNNLVDAPVFFEKMDPYSDFSRLTKDYIFHTDVDEMSISYLCSKPQFIGSFAVKTTDQTGTLCWSRPITPNQEVNTGTMDYIQAGVQTNFTTALIQNLGRMARFWRGGLKLHIQSSMTNFHFCKLTIARDYSPDVHMMSSYPTFESIPNLMTETLEFSAGGQVQVISLPFCAPLDQLPLSNDFLFNALSHGMYYIYLHQPLVTNGSVPTNIQFNVYLSADEDFEYFGYATDAMVERMVAVPTLSAQATASVLVNDQSDLLNGTKDVNPYADCDMRPLTSIRDLARRFNRVFRRRFSPGSSGIWDPTTLIQIPVSQLLGLNPGFISSAATNTWTSFDQPILNILQDMFLGYAGGGKFKIVVTGTTIGSVYYVPPRVVLNNGTTLNASSPNAIWRSASAIPPKTNTNTTNDLYRFGNDAYISVPNQVRTGLTQSYASPTVSIERSNVQNGIGDMLVSQEDASSTNVRVAMASSSYEFEIPFTSPYKFVGNGRALTISNDDNSEEDFATVDLGTILITLGLPTQYLSTVSEEPTAFYIEIYAAADDSARFGFQTFAPILTYPVYQVGSVSTGARYYQIGTSNYYLPTFGSTTTPPVEPYGPKAIVRNANDDYTSMYYAKIT